MAEALLDVFERTVAELTFSPEFREIEVVHHAARKQGKTTALAVMLDRAGGVDISACERVAAKINDALEGIEDEYTLEVESAGVDRPLFKPADYERFSGQNVKVVTTLPIASHKTFRGRLDGVRGTNVILTTESGELPIPLDIVKTVNIEFDIRADLSRAKREKKKGKS